MKSIIRPTLLIAFSFFLLSAIVHKTAPLSGKSLENPSLDIIGNNLPDTVNASYINKIKNGIEEKIIRLTFTDGRTIDIIAGTIFITKSGQYAKGTFENTDVCIKYFVLNDSLIAGIEAYKTALGNYHVGADLYSYSIEKQKVYHLKDCILERQCFIQPAVASIEFANPDKTLLFVSFLDSNCHYKYKLCDMTKNDTICNFQDVESGVQHRRSTRTDMYQGTYLNTDFINSFIDSSRQEILVGEKSSGVIYLSFPDRRHFNGLKNPFILEADDDGLSNRFRKYFLHSDDMISCIKIDTSHSKRTLTISTFEYTDNQFIHRNTKVVIDEEAPTDIGSIELIGDRILISYGSINYEAVDIHYKLVEIKPNAEIEINTLQTSLQEKFFIKPYIFSH